MVSDGWIYEGVGWYALATGSEATTGLLDENGTLVYKDSDSSYYTGLKTLNGYTYYFDGEKGLKTSTTVTVDGVTYTINSAGVCTLSLSALLSAIDSAGTAKSLSTINSSYKLSSSAAQKVQNAINSLTSAGYSVGFLMIDIKSVEGVVYDGGTSRYSASTIKGPYVAAINKFNLSQVSASVKSTMSTTIKDSSNSGYLSLRSKFGSSPMANMMSYCGVSSGEMSSSSNYDYYTPKTLAKLWAGMYWYFFEETNGNSGWCRDLFTSSTKSFIRSTLGGTYTTYTKPGWGDFSFGSVYNDAGIVSAGSNPYILVILSSDYGKTSYLNTLVSALNTLHSDMVS